VRYLVTQSFAFDFHSFLLKWLIVHKIVLVVLVLGSTQLSSNVLGALVEDLETIQSVKNVLQGQSLEGHRTVVYLVLQVNTLMLIKQHA
jgi:hypothetical protein